MKCKTDHCATLAVFSASLLVTFSTASATLWHIKADGSGDAPTIQAGIDLSADGDTVLVASGVYTGDGNRDIDFLGKAILVIAECRYDTTVADSTVIDCMGALGDCHRGFHFHSGESGSSILEGFTIINGFHHYFCSDEGSGGGILCDSSSSPTIRHNTIRGCVTKGDGGGIACLDTSTPCIFGNTIHGNVSGFSGGGIHCSGGSLIEIRQNRIIDNDGYHEDIFNWGYGGGIASFADSTIIVDNYIARNGSVDGGGIHATGSFVKIEGNEIYRNYAESLYSHGMAGIDIHGSMALILDNTISHNAAGKEDAAGIYLCSDEALISGNHVFGNVTQEGECAGIYVESSGIIKIRNNRIESNYSGDCVSEHGCGISISAHSGSDITDNVIMDNFGGGISCFSPIAIRNNLIVGNIGCATNHGGIAGNSLLIVAGNTIAENKGGGIYCGPAQICNNIICNNTCLRPDCSYQEEGCGIVSSSPNVEIYGCDVFGNEKGDYVGIPDQTGINGNISINPMFCDPANGDYSIDVHSPCAPGNHPDGYDWGLIGALDPTCDHTSTLLLGHEASLDRSAITVSWTVAIELGPDDFRVRRASGSERFFAALTDRAIRGDGTSFTFVDDRLIPGETYRYRVILLEESGPRTLFESDPITVPVLPLTLYQNHPNPFNPSTRISYYLPADGRVVLNVFDVSGRLVVRLLDENSEQGHHSLTWDGLDGRSATMSSGIYFCRLTAGKETVSRKMILLR